MCIRKIKRLIQKAEPQHALVLFVPCDAFWVGPRCATTFSTHAWLGVTLDDPQLGRSTTRTSYVLYSTFFLGKWQAAEKPKKDKKKKKKAKSSSSSKPSCI